MQHFKHVRRLARFRYKRQFFLVAACLAITAAVGFWMQKSSGTYVSRSPYLTQQFTGVMSEKMLLDFCYQLQGIHGITGVSYRDYSPAKRTAMITVYYNPQQTTVRQVRIFIEHASILWIVPKAT